MELACITKRLFHIRNSQVLAELMLEALQLVKEVLGFLRIELCGSVSGLPGVLIAMLLENLGFGVYLIPLLPAIFLNHK